MMTALTEMEQSGGCGLCRKGKPVKNIQSKNAENTVQWNVQRAVGVGQEVQLQTQQPLQES